ncbi:MAG: histidine kinase [Puniceicoccaceae bacterium 5H]|nr:MAG: histidine kinase [Puniceicoccaceae bacterium 5H]
MLLTAALLRWNKAYRELFDHLIREKSEQTAGIETLKQESLTHFVYDYSWWQDTIDFVQAPNDDWWTEELEGVPELFQADLIWFYDRSGQMVYERNERNELPVGQLRLPARSQFETWMSDLAYPHFFISTEYGLLEVAGSPLQPGEDLQRVTPAQGMMFAGRFFTEEYLGELQDLTNAYIRFEPRHSLPEGQPSANLLQNSHLQTATPLYGWDGQLIGQLVYDHQTQIFALFKQHLRSVVFLFVAILLVIVVVAAFSLPSMVLNPIIRLRTALTEQKERPLYPLLDRRDELGQLARLVRDFFQQKETLTNEMAARAKAVRAAEEAAREARRLERVKSEFLATMSHEIRTPMNAVVGFAELLREGELPTEEQEYAKIVVENSYALLHLLDDILDYSKLESDKIELQLEWVNLPDLVKQIVSTHQAKAKAKGVQVNMVIDERLPTLFEIDNARLRQVLNNLIDNAIKFTERGSVRISLETNRAYEAGKMVEVQFSVRDSGIGIRESQQRNIFEPFTQADSSTTRRFGGTGLGLAISSHLVALMGGKLEVESSYGRGSTFSFKLPLQSVVEETQAENGAVPVAAKNKRLAESLPLHILVVEDNPTSGQLIHIHLRRLGYNAALVTDGMDALERVQRERFDLILLDLQMPRMDGWTFVNRLRGLADAPWTQDVKIIAVSANKLRVETSALVIAGIQGFISKPYTFGALVNEIRRVCSADRPDVEDLGTPSSRDGAAS